MKTKLFMLCAIVCAMFLTCCEEDEPATSRKVETGKVSDITLTSATFHGVVNVDISQYSSVTFGVMLSDSKEELTERGGEMFKAKALMGKDFDLQVNNLSPETKYYFCAWVCLNSTQYEFGEIMDFETTAQVLPTVVTTEVREIGYFEATIYGEVKTDGGAIVTERGVVFSTSTNPTVSNGCKVNSGGGIGSFDCYLSSYFRGHSIQENTTYYVRAYAINCKGVAYGNEVSFTTKETTLPRVSQPVISNISYTSATVEADLLSSGGYIEANTGVVYSKLPNPTMDNDNVSGSPAGIYCDLINLKDGTTYYVRAYASNPKGITYSETVSFTTKKIIYEYVDLGLSVKWATFNVGATNPDEYGHLFAWGEVEKKDVWSSTWSNYKWCDGNSDYLTKYNREDGIKTLQLEDDVANVQWGGEWRMPTKEEVAELCENSEWFWSSNPYGVWVRSTKPGYTDKQIFLPASPHYGGANNFLGILSKYWTSSLSPEISSAYVLMVRTDGIMLWPYYCSRCEDHLVRPVYPL